MIVNYDHKIFIVQATGVTSTFHSIVFFYSKGLIIIVGKLFSVGLHDLYVDV
jgi:hypothetical protein